MKLSVLSAIHYVILSMALLLSPVKVNRFLDNASAIENQKIQQTSVSEPKATDGLKEEVLFLY